VTLAARLSKLDPMHSYIVKILKFSLLGLLTLSIDAFAQASYQPLPYADMNPLTMHYGSPRSTTAAPLERGQWQWQWGLDVGNTVHLQGSPESAEQLLIDAETQRHVAMFEYGLRDHWNLLLEVPYVRHSGGMLDGFIDDFHGALGFPSGPRASRNADDFALTYRRGQARLIDVDQPQSGLGDISLSLIGDFSSHRHDQLSAGLRLEFATGDADDLSGSGTFDVALWASASKRLFGDVSHFASLAAVAVENSGGLMANMRNSVYGTVRYGLAWRYSQRLEFKAQLDARSAIYSHSRMRALGHSTAASIGGTLHLPSGYALDIAVIEDIDVGTAPDVVFQLALRRRWGAY